MTPVAPGPAAKGISTPHLLRRLRAGLLVLLILVAGAAGWILGLSRDNLAQASVHAAEYVRLTSIGTDVLKADAAAGQAVLATSGAAARHEQVGTRLADASASLVAAVAAQPAHAAELAEVNTALQAHGRSLEAARHQQDASAAAKVLVAAGQALDSQLLPTLSSLAEENRRDTDVLLSQQLGWALPALAWAAVAALLAASWTVARRSHRIVNLGLVGAIVAIATVAVLSGSAVSAVTGSAVTARDGDFARVRAAVATQKLVAHAHSLDVRRVLAQEREEAAGGSADLLAEASSTLTAAGASELKEKLAACAQAHADLSALTTRGDWAAAASLVTSTAKGSPTATVAAFDAGVEEVVSTSGAAVADAATGFAGTLLAQAIGAAALALAAAGLAVWGLGQRLKEYR